MTETNDETRRILEYLNSSGNFCWRQNAVRVPGRHFPKKNRGIGDIIGVLKGGRHIEVEVKTGRDKPSLEQMNHSARVNERGGLHIFVADFNEFLHKYVTRRV
jgi:Holliday junction resolvase